MNEKKERASDKPGRGMMFVNKKKDAGNTVSPHFLGKVRDEDGNEFSIAAWLHEDHPIAALNEAGIYGLSLSLRKWNNDPDRQAV